MSKQVLFFALLVFFGVIVLVAAAPFFAGQLNGQLLNELTLSES